MMEMLQVGAEAAKSTSAIYFDGVAIMALIASGGLLAREYIKTKQEKKNGNGRWPKPGTATECLKHRDELTELKIENKNTKDDITEMKGDIKELLRRTPRREG